MPAECLIEWAYDLHELRVSFFIPDEVEEITAQWLTQVLRSQGIITSTVLTARHSVIGDDIGLLSKVVRTELSYDNPTREEPQTLIVKIEPNAGP